MFVPPNGLPALIPLNRVERAALLAFANVLDSEGFSTLSMLRVACGLMAAAADAPGSITQDFPLSLADLYWIAAESAEDDEDE